MPRIPLNMPKMSMTMEFGTVVEWLVDVGAQVRDGDAVVVVTTDKVDMEVETTVNGVLVEILARPEDQVPVGQPIGYIESEADDLLGDLFAAAPEAAEPEPAGEAPATEVAPPVREPAGERPRVVPLARRLAAEAGIDLSQVTPSGPGRTIRARDVREFAAGRTAASAAPATPAAPAFVPTAPVAPAGEPGALLGDAKSRRIRIVTAKVMEATAVIPQFTAYRVLDLSSLARARKAALRGVSWTSILVRAYAMVLRQYPQLNGFWTGEGVRPNQQVGVSIAIDTPSGLIAPVLADPDLITLRQLDEQLRSLIAAAKAGQVSADQLTGGTGTVSNLGGMGVDRFNALLTPPQATAFSLGAVAIRPIFAEDGGVVPQVCCEVGLTIDHRTADGADAARALQTMQEFLQDPFLLLA